MVAVTFSFNHFFANLDFLRVCKGFCIALTLDFLGFTTFLREIFTKSGTLAFRHFYHHLLVYTTAGTVSGKFMHTSRCRSIFDFHILLSGTAVQLLAGAIKVQTVLLNTKPTTGFPVKIWLLKWLRFWM